MNHAGNAERRAWRGSGENMNRKLQQCSIEHATDIDFEGKQALLLFIPWRRGLHFLSDSFHHAPPIAVK
jgi:hypothetical protein